MHRIYTLLTSLSIALCLAACSSAATTPTAQTIAPGEEAQVRELIEEFGTRLRDVSLLGPNVEQEMATHYGPLVSPELLAAWQAAPTRAPGRQTSSPWPERIEIQQVQLRSATEYAVSAEIIELTSDGQSFSYPVALRVRKIADNWLIDGYTAQGQP